MPSMGLMSTPLLVLVAEAAVAVVEQVLVGVFKREQLSNSRQPWLRICTDRLCILVSVCIHADQVIAR